MTQWELMRRWLTRLALAGLLGLLVSCGDSGGGEGCGGIEDLISCLSITSITPTDASGEASSNVDAVQDVCSVDATTGVPTLEPFTDHNATVTFSNTAHPNASGSLAVTLRSVTIVYSLNNCPTGAICPPLPGFTESVTLVIPEGGTASGTFSFVPLEVKASYIAQSGSVGASPPSYSVNYTFTGRTQFFSDTITIRGSASFTIGNFDLCE